MKRFDTEKELRAHLKTTDQYYYNVWSIRLNDPHIDSKDAAKSDVEKYVISEIEKQHANDNDSVCYCVFVDELTKGVFDLYLYHSKTLYCTFRSLETISNIDKNYYSVDYLTWNDHRKSLGKKMEIHHDGFGNELNVGDTFVDMKIGHIAEIERMTNQKIIYSLDDSYETTVFKTNAFVKICKRYCSSLELRRLSMDFSKFTFASTTYQVDGSTAIQMFDGDGAPWCTVTVNLSCYSMYPEDKNHVFIPTYKIDDETLNFIKQKLIKNVCRSVPIGMGEGIYVELADNWKEIAPAV